MAKPGLRDTRVDQNEERVLPEASSEVTPKTTGADHAQLANAIRALSMDAVQAANSGHPGMPMGAADMATVLFTKYLKYNPADPNWADRDRFVLSAGHGSMLLYSLLHLTGYTDLNMDQLRNFRQLGSKTAGHPEYGEAGGIEMTTGPLGQGLSTAVGMAIAERSMNARYGDDLVDHRTWVIASDGDLMEGISHEASSLAGHMKLGRLIVLYDDNDISIDGGTEMSLSDDAIGRFDSYGWHTQRCDGHDAGGPRRRDGSGDSVRQAVDHCLQNRDRVRRAEQAGHVRRSWRTAWRRRDRRRPRSPELAA